MNLSDVRLSNRTSHVSQMTLSTCRVPYPGRYLGCPIQSLLRDKTAFSICVEDRHLQLRFRGLLRLHFALRPV